MKKTLALLMAVLMLFGTFASGVLAEAAEETAVVTFESSDDEIYDYILGDFEALYDEAMTYTDMSERYVREAMAEAKLLESGVMLPTNTQGGSYGLRKYVPKTINSTLWGSDSNRYYTVLVTTDIIKAEDYNEMKAMWNSAADAEDYLTQVKAFLEEKGYTLKDDFNIAYSSDPQTWDVLASYQSVDNEVLVNTYDGLLVYDIKNQQQPALAESYEVSDDGLTYTFHIRQGVKWVDSQGREIGEVTADDWVAGAQHLMDAQAGLEWLVDGLIEGATEYMNGEITDFSEVGVKALDDYTLEYTLAEATPYFTTMLAYSIFAPMNRAYFLAQGGAFGVSEFAEAKDSGSYTYGTGPDTIAYCGPYLITSFTEKNTIQFTANSAYWNPDALGVHTITWKFNDGTDVTKAYYDLQAGDIDGCTLTSSTLEIAKSDGIFDEYVITTDTNAASFNAWLNVKRQIYANTNDSNIGVSTMTDEQKELEHAALLNVHFRRAVCFAVDRATFNAQVKGEDLKYNSLINAYVPGDFVYLEHDVTVDINGESVTFPAGTAYGAIRQAQLEADGSPIKAYDEELGNGNGFDGWYNPEAAVAELEIAIEELKAQGYEISAENPVYLDYAGYTGNENYKNQAQAYKQSVEAVLGGAVIVNIVGYETSTDWYNAAYYPSTGAEMNYDISTVSGWSPDYGDPKSYLQNMLPGANGMGKNLGLY